MQMILLPFLLLVSTPRSILDVTSKSRAVDGCIHGQAIFQRGIGTTLFAPFSMYSDDKLSQIQLPPYYSWVRARDVLSDPCFYHSQEMADLAKKQREGVLQEMSLGEVFQKYIAGHENDVTTGVQDFADLISARAKIVELFFCPPKQRVNEALVREKLIDLSGTREIQVFEEIGTYRVPTVENIWQTTSAEVNSQGAKTRALPLCLVLGPSGSGKTFFALQYLATGFLNTRGKEQFTVYVRPDSKNIEFKDTNPLAPKELMNDVRERCARHICQNIMAKIDMHVCIILDGAGSIVTKSWFENKQVLERLCHEASEMASSVAIVLVGTGLTGYNLSPVDDAYIFRMQPWQPNDLSKILAAYKTTFHLEWDETIDTVVNAICSHPKLGALATNAKMVYSLRRALIQRSCTIDRRSGWSWDRQLEEWWPSLVTEVVDSYIAYNCLSSLSTENGRRVAAVVFRALQEMRQGDGTLPTFPALQMGQIRFADALVQYNLEWRDGMTQVVPDEEFAFTVTPALAIVLYQLAGVPSTVPFVPASRVHVEVAALYAFRQAILECTECFASDLRNGSFPEQLDQSLAKVCLLKLDKALESNAGNILVPMVHAETIMINGDGHSFVDVIAPYTLIKCISQDPSNSFSTSPPLKVNLLQELDNCGLLKKSRETRLLRALLALWQGNFDMVNDDMRGQGQGKMSPQLSPKVRRHPQLSKAFPESYLSRVKRSQTIKYTMIKGKSGSTISMGKGKKPIPLPDLDGTIHPMTWILSTNAEVLRVQLGRSTIAITEDNLDENLEINVETLHDDLDKSAWTSLVTEKVQEGVKIKFLFTN